MFLSTEQKERDSATAYRKILQQDKAYWAVLNVLYFNNSIFNHSIAGMTMEVLGTLVGAAIQGQIVASAHTLKHCPTHNVSAGYLGNSSGAEIIVRSQDHLPHAVSVTVPSHAAQVCLN